MKDLKSFIIESVEDNVSHDAPEEEKNYVVYQTGGYVAHTANATIKGKMANVIASDLSKEEAMDMKKRYNKILSPWEKNHVGISYSVTDKKNVKYLNKD